MVIIMMLSGCACAAVSVRLEDTAALLNSDGSVIVAPGIYGDIVSLGGGLYAAGSREGYALMNSGGELLTVSEYGDLRLSGTTVLGSREGLWGLLDTDGQELSKFEYTKIVAADAGFWALKGSLSDQDSDELFLLDAEGGERETGLFIRRIVDAASEGLIAVQEPESLLWGYCDTDGKLVIPAQYSHAGRFTAGLAAVVQNTMYGAIDGHGSWVVPARYDSLEVSPGGFLLAHLKGEGAQVFSRDGSLLAEYHGEETFAFLAGDGYGVVQGGQMRFYDAGGALLFEASRQASVQEGLNGAYILSDGVWGENCVSIAGTECAYQNLYPLGMNGDEALYACMQVNTARYMNDLLGEIQLAVDMESARYGVVNGSGEMLIPAEYESVQYLGEGRLLLHIEGLWQMTDARGAVLWSHGFRRIEEPSF